MVESAGVATERLNRAGEGTMTDNVVKFMKPKELMPSRWRKHAGCTEADVRMRFACASSKAPSERER